MGRKSFTKKTGYHSNRVPPLRITRQKGKEGQWESRKEEAATSIRGKRNKAEIGHTLERSSTNVDMGRHRKGYLTVDEEHQLGYPRCVAVGRVEGEVSQSERV